MQMEDELNFLGKCRQTNLFRQMEDSLKLRQQGRRPNLKKKAN